MEVNSLKSANYQTSEPTSEPIKMPDKSASSVATKSKEPVVAIEKVASLDANQEAKAAKNKEEDATSAMFSQAMESANQKLRSYSRRMEYSVHKETNRVIVKVLNTQTNEVIREIPHEKTLDNLAKVLEAAGLMLDQKR